MAHLPSGKRLHNYGKSPCLMGKSTVNGPCSSSQTVNLPEATSMNYLFYMFFFANLPCETGPNR